jgi:hypothetical protein
MTWGLGNVKAASISTLAKDLRSRLMGLDSTHTDWELDPSSYTIQAVAHRMTDFVFDELGAKDVVTPDNPLGLLVAGYSAGEHSSEAWLIQGATTGVMPDGG